MAMNERSETCRCSLHRQLELRQHVYRRLALAILSPEFASDEDFQPSEPVELTRAAERLRQVRPLRAA